MAYDGLFIRRMVEPLRSSTTGCVHKINQPGSDTILMVVRQNRQNHQSLLLVHPNFSGLQLAAKKYGNPLNPPMSVRVLRKHLEGSIIGSIKQIGDDRRAETDTKSKDEIGDTIYRTVIPETMDKHSNLILVDENCKIIEGLKHLTPNMNHYRTVMPGLNYEASPTRHKIDSYGTTGVEVLKYTDFNVGNITKQLLSQFEGFSPLITNEVVSRRQLTTSSILPEAFDEVMAEIELPPTSILHKNHEASKEDFYFIKLD